MAAAPCGAESGLEEETETALLKITFVVSNLWLC